MSITANGTISDDINLILTSTLPFPAILGTGTGLCNSSNINYASPTNSAYGNGNVEVSNNNAFLTLSDVNGTRDGISSDVHYISASFQYQIFLI